MVEYQKRSRRQAIGPIVLAVLAVVLWLPVIAHLAVAGLADVLAVVFLVASILAALGRRRARIVAAVAGGALVIVMAPYWVQGFGDDDNAYGGEYAVIDMIAAVLCVTAIVLLYRTRDRPA